MTRIALAMVIGLLLLTVAVLQPSPVQTLAQAQPPAGTRHTGKAFRFNQVKDGIYHAVGTGALAVVGNSAVIVNDNDVIVERRRGVDPDDSGELDRHGARRR